MDNAARMRKSRADRAKIGGHRIDVMLSAKAAAKLRKLMGGDKRASEVVNELLERTR